jgi:Ca2+-binding RTX toxin-like protein/V8-like Glu-specific endopeptidase
MSLTSGGDTRALPLTSNIFPLNAVVAVDSTFPVVLDYGSGIAIAPNHVLTAGHIVFRNGSLSVPTGTTISTNLPAIATRTAAPNVINQYFPKNFTAPGAPSSSDIALLQTNNSSIIAANTLGLIAFVNPTSANGLTINTAGYPGSPRVPNPTGIVVPRSRFTGTTLVLSPGTGTGTIVSTVNNGRFFYSSNVDTEGGQSGSGVWHVLAGDTAPRVLGVHTSGTGTDASGTTLTQNGGVLITTDVYDTIINQIALDSGTSNASALPENALVGSDRNFALTTPITGDDTIIGSYRRERILGGSGDDRLFGGGADDRLEGGDGVDQALFSDVFTNYTYNITDPNNRLFTFDHTGGTRLDARDSLREIEFGVFEFEDVNRDRQDDDGNVFFVPLQVDSRDPTKLQDGPDISPEREVLDDQGNNIGTITVRSPAWTFDGDVNYSLSLGARQGTLFNFAYIIDTSGSIEGEPLDQAKQAYQTLTQSLISNGIAARSEFAVIEFNSFATLTGPIDAATAISTINGLSAGGGTEFGDALNQAQQFFRSRNNNATNIAYFLSDGFGSGASDSLQSVAEVRAFGIGGADLTALDIIDSDDAVQLNNPADLVTQFSTATVDRNTIDRIDVRLAGVVVDTITPDELVVDTLGRLSYDGTIDRLTVGRTADNQVTFDLIFNNGTPTTSLNYRITSGQQEVRSQSTDGTREVIVFSVNQSDFTESANGTISAREINGNNLANIITISSGNNILRGNGGNDQFVLNGGTNLVDGGDGIDTVRINRSQAASGIITRNGSVVNIGSETTLLNTEFIEFNDVRLSVDTLAVAPVISLNDRVITLSEGNSGSRTASFIVNLTSPSTQPIVIDYSTRSTNATVGADFVANIGQLTIVAGQTTGNINIEVLGDVQAEGDEQIFLDLATSSTATFSDGGTATIGGVNIQDDDSAIGVSIIADDPTFIEGNPNQPTSAIISLERFGSLVGTDIVEYQIAPTGSTPVQANDFVNGFTPGQITFAPGESSKQLEILLAPDQSIEGDETFGLRLISLSGTATLPTSEILLTIRDDDSITSNPNPNPVIIDGTPGQDTLTGTVASEQINGLDDNDILNGLDGDDTVTGNGGDDLIRGGNGQDQLFGTDGNDIIDGENGNDFIRGESGDDSLYGANDNDTIFGGDGRDLINGGFGNDVLDGEAGGDFLFGDLGDDSLYGANGDDTLFGGEGGDLLNGGFENDILDGSQGNDRLFGDVGDDSLYGADDNDTLLGGDGRDVINGGFGQDLLDGGQGDDFLFGDAGNDTLFGSAGQDTLIGGDGLDIFGVSNQGPADFVLDFQRGTDKIALDRNTFQSLQSSAGNGFSQANDFAVVASDGELANSPGVLVYNSNNGLLYYKNPVTTASPLAVAQFNSSPLLVAQDFVLV